jgi:hypothetical protein
MKDDFHNILAEKVYRFRGSGFRVSGVQRFFLVAGGWLLAVEFRWLVKWSNGQIVYFWLIG